MRGQRRPFPQVLHLCGSGRLFVWVNEMSATAEKLRSETPFIPPWGRPLVIVGTGPVGMRVAHEVLQRNSYQSIVLYGGEPWEAYNRVRLSSVLSGEASLESIQNPLTVTGESTVVQRHNCPITSIDRMNRVVLDEHGREQPYTDLVLATGSSPHIPNIPGLDKAGVFTFRDLNDTQRLMARRIKSRRTVVLGAGLLGLEAAKGLQRANTEVIVVDHAPTLMARQLDEEAGERLREHVLSLGIQTLLMQGISEVLGDGKLAGIRLRNGREIACDTLVIATGIKPNIQLALGAGIAVGRGIKVDDQMRSSDPHVFAVGECAEHRGKLYGQVAPGLEQAAVLAHSLTGGDSRYSGSLSATKLKVVGVSVFSMGRTGLDESGSQLRSEIYRDSTGTSYKKVLLDRGRLVGAMAVGEWPDLARVQESINKQRHIWPWQLRRFMTTGRLWAEKEAEQVTQWPANATVCQCIGVTRGALSLAIGNGCQNAEALARCTGASTVCGSCKPLLNELLGGSTPIEAEKGSGALTWAAAFSLVLALVFLVMPNIPYADSVQWSLRWDMLWRDALLKQTTGFTLLGLGVFVSLISLRKRIKKFSLGSFAGWRVVHVLSGVMVAAILIAHTGLRLGYNLNLMLMLSFVGLMLVGAVAAGAIGLQHRLPGKWVRRTRELSQQLHIWLLWPLPALLGFHVFKTYWF